MSVLPKVAGHWLFGAGRVGSSAVPSVVPVRVDQRTVGGVAGVVPDGHHEVVRRERIVVVAEELVRERIRARPTRIAVRRTAVDVAPRADRSRRAIHLLMADDTAEVPW